MVALALTLGLAAAGLMPVLLAGAYLGLSGLSYFMYLFDKTAAAKGARRTPENALHVVDLLGGWPGALFAQQQFRHKTAKTSFQVVFWATVALNLAAAWWLMSSGTALQVIRSLSS